MRPMTSLSNQTCVFLRRFDVNSRTSERSLARRDGTLLATRASYETFTSTYAGCGRWRNRDGSRRGVRADERPAAAAPSRPWRNGSGPAQPRAVDAQGHNFVDDLGVGDVRYFPSGIPHSIQGLGPDGCEFLLVFDDGTFDEDNTFLISDWFKHTPREILSKNFSVPASAFGHVPDPKELYIFSAPVPGALATDRIQGATAVANGFSYRMTAQQPIRTKSGMVRIVDSRIFPVSTAIAAALVEVDPGGMRELHWHPNTDEWQYYIEGQGRMGVFGASGQARTFDFQAGDVGYVPFAMGHYIENTGSEPLRFLEMFRSSYYADVSLDQWIALTPSELVQAHLRIDARTIDALRKDKKPIVPA